MQAEGEGLPRGPSREWEGWPRKGGRRQGRLGAGARQESFSLCPRQSVWRAARWPYFIWRMALKGPHRSLCLLRSLFTSVDWFLTFLVSDKKQRQKLRPGNSTSSPRANFHSSCSLSPSLLPSPLSQGAREGRENGHLSRTGLSFWQSPGTRIPSISGSWPIFPFSFCLCCCWGCVSTILGFPQPQSAESNFLDFVFLRSVETFSKSNIKLIYSYCINQALFYFSSKLLRTSTSQILKDMPTIYL